MHGSYQMIYPVIIRKVCSFKINDKIFHNNWRIVKIWSALGPKKLGLGALNRIVCWETNWKTLTAWKIRPKELLTERLIDQQSIKAWKTRLEYKEDK